MHAKLEKSLDQMTQKLTLKDDHVKELRSLCDSLQDERDQLLLQQRRVNDRVSQCQLELTASRIQIDEQMEANSRLELTNETLRSLVSKMRQQIRLLLLQENN